MDKCFECQGSGYKRIIKQHRCEHCNGFGTYKGTLGPFVDEQPCSQCGGKGFYMGPVVEQCPACGGTGRN